MRKQITLTPEYIDVEILRSGTYEKDAISDGIGGGRNEKGKISVMTVAHCGDGAAWEAPWRYAGKDGAHEEKKTSLRIGVLLYRGDDTFIGTLRSSMEQDAKEYEQETGDPGDAGCPGCEEKSDDAEQPGGADDRLNCDVLCVNMVDRSAASGVIDKRWRRISRLSFFNREPVAEDMNRWEKLYYVGADAKGVGGPGGADPRGCLPEESGIP